MDSVPLDLAFSRFGAVIKPRQRLLSATAQDGSLVLLCQSSGFSRPGAGVLRYSARMSLMPVPATQVEALRRNLDAARSGAKPVRLIIQTPGIGKASNRVHMREDLVGSIVEFDGDAYSVDFVRLAEPASEPAVRSRRKR